MKRSIWSAALVGALVLTAGAGCDKGGDGAGTSGEVVEQPVELRLPAPPEFRASPVNPDGTHSVTELRQQGRKYVDKGDIQVKGYVVFKYDCAVDLRGRLTEDARAAGKEITEKELAKLVETELKERPEKCERPHFYLADAANANRELSLWVVDVPREARSSFEKQDAKAHPELYAEPVFCPGDQVTVTGAWTTKSPKGFINLSGLLVFKAVQVAVSACPPPVTP